MGRERTLLERIAAGGVRPTRHDDARENVEELMESVRCRLIALLNSRQGMSEAQPDYGLPSLVDVTVSSPDYRQKIQNAIRATIEKYEPRLKRVRVTLIVDDPADAAEHGPRTRVDTLAFRIEGVLAGQEGQYGVRYQTALTRNGLFEVAD